MIEEAAVFGGEHGLDQMIRQLVHGHGILVDDATMADLIAVAIEEGDGEIALGAPVPLRLLEGRQRQRQHQHGAGSPERQALAGQFDENALEAAHAKATEEDGDLFPRLCGPKTEVPDCRIDPGIETQQGMPQARPVIVLRGLTQNDCPNLPRHHAGRADHCMPSLSNLLHSR